MDKRARIRFNEITPKTRTVVVGRKGEKVVAFEFRNEGSNSEVSFTKDGAGVALLPNEEKPYAVDGLAYFEEIFTVNFSVINGANPYTHKAILTEIYHKI